MRTTSATRFPTFSSIALALTVLWPGIGAATGAHATKIPTSISNAFAEMRTRGEQAWARELAAVHRAPPHVAGSTLEVTSCADDGGPGTLRSVVASALTGDVVDLTGLTCDRITLTGGYVLDNSDVPSFSIVGPGISELTITSANASGIFYHQGTGTLRISDLSVTEGYAEDSWGGCLLAPSGGFDLERVSVSACTAHQTSMLHGSNAMGGGISTFAELTLTDSVITGNTLSSDLPDAGPYSNLLAGGGAFALLGPLTITRSVVSDNSIVSAVPIQGAVRGGGVMSYAGPMTVADSVVSGNSLHSEFYDDPVFFSRSSGAGLELGSGADLVLTNTTVDNNSIVNTYPIARSYGAGVSFSGNSATIASSTFSNNYSMGGAAGINDHGSSLSLTNSTVSGNRATAGAAGLYAVGTLQITNSTIAFNVADDGVGGLATHATSSIVSTIVALNTGTGVSPDVDDFGSGLISGDHDFIGVPGAVNVPADTLTGDPLLAPLAHNGGRTQTHALGVGSTAIDAGSNPDALDFDQRGTGFSRANGKAVDIGAFETGNDRIFTDGFDTARVARR